MLPVRDDVSLAIDRGEICSVVLGLGSSFDTVDHSISFLCYLIGSLLPIRLLKCSLVTSVIVVSCSITLGSRQPPFLSTAVLCRDASWVCSNQDATVRLVFALIVSLLDNFYALLAGLPHCLRSERCSRFTILRHVWYSNWVLVTTFLRRRSNYNQSGPASFLNYVHLDIVLLLATSLASGRFFRASICQAHAVAPLDLEQR
jgi:hypothetical protein